MKRAVGTVVRGLRGPIVNEGDDIVEIVVETVLNAAEIEGYSIQNRDVVSITESIVARAQGDFATIDDIAADVQNKYGSGTIGVVFPILSRNRFYQNLKGIARAMDEVIVQLSYPTDEVGNALVSRDALEENNINPWTDVLTEEEFFSYFGSTEHIFTGVDYVDLYRQVIEDEGAKATIIFANQPEAILDYTDAVLAGDIHDRQRTKRKLKEEGAKLVLGLDDILTESLNGSGFNEEYGLLGANLASEEKVKLFPSNPQPVVDNIQNRLKEETGKIVEVMVFGDGAFNDPSGDIWELADPVVAPAYTKGLEGTPSEVKLKYLADDTFEELEGEELEQAITEFVRDQDSHPEKEGAEAASLGTTPRRITDLIGSLSDLTSGSGDKGTPFVYIQGYFDNISDN